MKTAKQSSRRTNKLPEFVLCAERAMRRMARKLRRESALTGKPLVLGEDYQTKLVYFGFDKKFARRIIVKRTINLKDTWAKEAQKI